MTEIKKSYYAIIPANVRYDENLTPNAKLLYGEITALCNEKGYCWAGNSYFANLYGVSNKSVSNWINQLVDRGYLTSEMNYKEGSKEVLSRYLRIAAPMEEKVNTYGKKVHDPMEEKFHTYGRKVHDPMEEKVKDNNTLNNTLNNTTNIDDRFEYIWSKYPRKVGKQKAYNSYKKAIKDGTTNEEIEQGVENYLEHISVNKVHDQYIKHGSTWFNNRSWEDEYELAKVRNDEYDDFF